MKKAAFFSLIFLAILFLNLTTPIGAVYQPGEKVASGQFAPHQVVVKYRSGEDPEKIANQVMQKEIRDATLFGRLQNAFEDSQLRLQGKQTAQEKLAKLKSLEGSIGAVSSKRLFESNVLGDESPKPLAGFFLYSTDGSLPVETMVYNFRKLEQVEFAEPNYTMTKLTHDDAQAPNDPLFPRMWHLDKIKLEEAWHETRGESAVTVAVVDTGVETAHEDFAGRIFAPGRDFALCDSEYQLVNGSLYCPAPKSCPKAAAGYCKDEATDDDGHGTHVAGTIGAIPNNTKGVAGINWEVKILPVKVLNREGKGYDSWITDGIYYAVNQGAKVVNLSLGSSDPLPCPELYRQTITYAYEHGVAVVVAAGNSAGPAGLYPPANCPNTVVVAATGPNDELASYSNYGQAVTLAAPGGNTSLDRNGDGKRGSGDCYEPNGTAVYGECVLSTVLSTTGRNYRLFVGTSMAAPHVSGVAALMLSKNASLTPDQLKTKLRETADSIGGQTNKRLNAYQAVLAAGGGVHPTVTVTPSVLPTATLTPIPSGTPAATVTASVTPLATATPTGLAAASCPAECPAGKPPRKSGNANCDETIDEADYILWRSQWREYQAGREIHQTQRSADFYCLENVPNSKRVDLVDFEIWRRSRFATNGLVTVTATPPRPTATPSVMVPTTTPSPTVVSATPTLTMTPVPPSATPTPIVPTPTFDPDAPLCNYLSPGSYACVRFNGGCYMDYGLVYDAGSGTWITPAIFLEGSGMVPADDNTGCPPPGMPYDTVKCVCG